MFGHQNGNVVHKARSFFSTLAWGISLIVITAIISGTVLAGYGMNIVDRKTNSVFDLVEAVLNGLPELTDALPPVLADAIHDQRRPEYAGELEVSVRLAESSRRRGACRPVVELHNNGSEVVSLLSMRVVVLNQRGEPVAQFNEWAATPIAADDAWPGPLLPGATRHLSVGTLFLGEEGTTDDFHAEVEITDVRVWDRDFGREVSLTGDA
jgi:hypothetical protein